MKGEGGDVVRAREGVGSVRRGEEREAVWLGLQHGECREKSNVAVAAARGVL